MKVDDRLAFILGMPRSGTTLLVRLLHATPGAHATPEPHLLTPLLHQGWFERVERAPYDPILTQRALRGFIRGLPGGEGDYLDALRAYCAVLYGRALQSAPEGTRWFVDKTPAYASIAGHLVRVFPEARYLLVRRHPAAILHSQAVSFFGGDFEEAARIHPVVARFLPPLARLIRRPPERLRVLDFEALVARPGDSLEACTAFLDLPYDPGALDYQRAPWPREGAGDPLGVVRFARPEASRADAWTARLAHDATARRCVERQLAAISDEDLASWGWPRERLWEPLEGAGGADQAWRPGGLHDLRRRLLLGLRRGARHPRLRPWVQRARDACEVLLREGAGPARASADEDPTRGPPT